MEARRRLCGIGSPHSACQAVRAPWAHVLQCPPSEHRRPSLSGRGLMPSGGCLPLFMQFTMALMRSILSARPLLVVLLFGWLRDCAMRNALVMLATVAFFAASGAMSFAGNFKTSNGRLTIAQSYCVICSNDRASCVVKCNGAGVCIARCDDDYRLCVEQACRR
jgi:hypothetical protein